MPERKNYHPVPLAEQVEAIEREADLAHERLPQLARPTNHGRPPKMHWGTVQVRLAQFESLRRTLRILKQLEDEGRLPPELQL